MAKTYSKTDMLKKTEIFFKMWAKKLQRNGHLEVRLPGQLIGSSSEEVGHVFEPEILRKIVQKVPKTCSKTDMLRKAVFFLKKGAKTYSKTGILKYDFLAN